MGALAITVTVGLGLLIGVGIQYLTHPKARLDWLAIAAALIVGAYVGSELLTRSVFSILAGGPTLDGLLIAPAVVTGLGLGLLADAFVRYIAADLT
jgi:hypothetical protein